LSYSHTRGQTKVTSQKADLQTERLWIKLKLSKVSKLGAILVLHSQWRARKKSYKKDLQVTLQVFFSSHAIHP